MKPKKYISFEERILGYLAIGAVIAVLFGLYVLFYWLITGELPKTK